MPFGPTPIETRGKFHFFCLIKKGIIVSAVWAYSSLSDGANKIETERNLKTIITDYRQKRLILGDPGAVIGSNKSLLSLVRSCELSFDFLLTRVYAPGSPRMDKAN